jgi:hypothetical protein
MKVIYQNFLKGLKKTTKPVGIAGVLDNIRTKNLPKTRLERYNYIHQVGRGILNSAQIQQGIPR